MGLISLGTLPFGLAIGGLSCVLTRNRDLAESWRQLLSSVWQVLKHHNWRPEAVASTYAALVALGGMVASTYELVLRFSVDFKNRSLAALLLACLLPMLLAMIILLASAVRIMLIPTIRAIGRISAVRVLASVVGALALGVMAVAGLAILLVRRYLAIVEMIDWRPLAYPMMLLIGTALIIGLLLHFRSRRLARRMTASRLRRALLCVWSGVLLALWSYSLVAFDDQTTLRTALLRRGYGVARTMDVLNVLLDFDHDGYISFFGGGDCAPFDRDVHPGAVEIADNGIDDNCFGGDLHAGGKAMLRHFEHRLPESLARRRPNIVLITLDDLRADHVGAYGYKRQTTPNIDGVARRGVLFERAYAQGPSTRFSIPSFLTSKYSSQIPRKNVTDVPEPVEESALLMAEVFQQAGYRTGAALSYRVFGRKWRIDQGFDVYDVSQARYYDGKGGPGWDPDQLYRLVDVAKRFLADNPDKPFFLWVHFFEPHPPNIHRTKPRDFGSDIAGQYDGELCFADAKVGELLDEIHRHPAANNTVIVVASDHGRGLGEHGSTTHGWDLYQPNLHVPLIIAVPGLQPRRIRNPVGLIDLLPTFVNLCHIQRGFDFEGQSLVPQLVDGTEPPADRPLFSEVFVGFHNTHVINSITTRDFKLIYDVTFNAFQLFDLRIDPDEKNEASARLPKELKRMQGLLNGVRERATAPSMRVEIESSMLPAAPDLPNVKRVNFGNQIEFLGFEVRPARPRAGDVLEILWYLRALTKMPKDYKMLGHLRGNGGEFLDTKHVALRGKYPSTSWIPGQVFRDRQLMRLSRTAQEYEVWVGFGTGHDILHPTRGEKLVNTTVLVGKFATN